MPGVVVMMGLAHFVESVRAERLAQLEEALRRRPGGEWRCYRPGLELDPGRVQALWLVRADQPELEKVSMVVQLDNYEAFQMALKELVIAEFVSGHGFERVSEVPTVLGGDKKLARSRKKTSWGSSVARRLR